MKFNNPLPQPLPKECQKAARIFSSFVVSGNHGLDGIIPRHVLENARGFAIFTVFKAGFVVSARAGTGVVIARLEDGSWSAPSAIGTAGMGFGGQLGAEVTDFLLVLNSRSSLKQFMSAGSLTFGGNMTIAIGPVGRNGEVTGALSTEGKVAAMYCYSKSKGLFGGVSLEGSAIVERQDANALAYDADVSAKMLLSGAVPQPAWADELISTLERCTGLPGGRKWVETPLGTPDIGRDYAFSGVGSPGSKQHKKKDSGGSSPFPMRKRDSYFGQNETFNDSPPPSPGVAADPPMSFGTSFKDERPTGRRRFSSFFSKSSSSRNTPQYDSPPPAHSRTFSQYESSSSSQAFPDDDIPPSRSYSQREMRHPSADFSRNFTPSSTGDGSFGSNNLIDLEPLDGPFSSEPSSILQRRSSNPFAKKASTSASAAAEGSRPHLTPRAGLAEPLSPGDVGRAIALHDFDAVEDGDLSFMKGEVIYIIKKTDSTNDWWKGRVGQRMGNFPANYVEMT